MLQDLHDSCGSGYGDFSKVRVVFEKDSHMDMWFTTESLWNMSAWDVKRAAHGITSALVEEAESELEGAAQVRCVGDTINSTGGDDVTGRPMALTARVEEGNSAQGGPGSQRRHNKSLARGGTAFVDRRVDASRRNTPGTESATRRRQRPVVVRSFWHPLHGCPGSPPAKTVAEIVAAQPASPRHDVTSPSSINPTMRTHGGKPAKESESPVVGGISDPLSPPAGDSSVQALPETEAGANATGTTGGVDHRATAAATGASSVLAYSARLRIDSVVLHFRAKGLRPGTFLFRAAAPASREGSGGRDVAESVAAQGNESQATRRGDKVGLPGKRGASPVSGAGEKTATATASPISRSLDPDSETVAVNDECLVRAAPSGGANIAAEVEVSEQQPDVVDRGAKQRPVEQNEGDDRVGYWLTNERAPLSAALESQRRQGASSRSLVLWLMPAGRAPLPSLCCGVCGSSWETDARRRGFRVYHLAVATNASLVWYVRKRFSEFLALHAALLEQDQEREGGGSLGGRGILAARLPKPPSRTFGMIKLFPEKVERFRRAQLDSYMQQLLAIPEALTNRLVLAFLGLVSTSRYDLMSPSKPKRPTPSARRTPTLQSPPRRGSTFSPPSMPSTTSSPPLPTTSLTSSSLSSPLAATNGCTTSFNCNPQRVRVNLTDDETPGAERPSKHPRQVTGAAVSGSGGVVSPPSRSRPHPGVVNATSESVEGVAPEDSGVRGEGEEREEEEEGTGEPAERKVELVSNLNEAARGGDIFFFRCKGPLSRLQRWISRSEWDHVGVAVSRGRGHPLELLESVNQGVRRYPFVDRVRAYQEEGFASRVAFRRLDCPRPVEARARLAQFATEVEGKAYGFFFPFPAGAPVTSADTTRSPPPFLTAQRTTPTPSPKTTMDDRDGDGGSQLEESEDTRNTAPKDIEARPQGDNGEQGQGVGHEQAAVVNRTSRPQCTESSREQRGESRRQPTENPPPRQRKSEWEQTAATKPSTYLCSQLVVAALSEMGVFEEKRGPREELERCLWVLPGAFCMGGAVERALGPGVSLGEEILVDGHQPEVATAVVLSDNLYTTEQ